MKVTGILKQSTLKIIVVEVLSAQAFPVMALDRAVAPLAVPDLAWLRSSCTPLLVEHLVSWLG